MEGPAYLLLDHNGSPLDLVETLEEAMTAANEFDPSGTIYLDAPTKQNFVSIEAGQQQQLAIAANPKPKLRVVGRGPQGTDSDALRAIAAAMKREPEHLIDYEAAMAMSLEQAHGRLVDLFPTQKLYDDGTATKVDYASPLAMAHKFLGQNYKTEKGTPKGIIKQLYERTGLRKANVLGLSLLPSTQSYTEPMVRQIMSSAQKNYGVKRVLPTRLNACVRATTECSSSCLAFSGRNLADDYNTVKKYSLMQALVHEPEAFIRILWEAISLHRDASFRASTMPLVRLNVFSDLPWELMVPRLFLDFYNVQFYDYTKVPDRNPNDNYDLTFSFAGTERNVASMDTEISKFGRRVAVVFAATGIKRLYEVEYDGRKVRSGGYQLGKLKSLAEKHGTKVHALGEVGVPRKPVFMRKKPGAKKAVRFDARLPEDFLGLPVVDGDESDMRPYDPAPSIVGLRWKTPANQGVTLEEANVFIVLVDVVPIGGGYHHCIVSKTPRFDDVDYAKYAPDVTD